MVETVVVVGEFLGIFAGFGFEMLVPDEMGAGVVVLFGCLVAGFGGCVSLYYLGKRMKRMDVTCEGEWGGLRNEGGFTIVVDL